MSEYSYTDIVSRIILDEISVNELNELVEALEEHFATLIESKNRNKKNKYNLRERLTMHYVPKNKLNKNIIIRRKK